MNDNGFAALRNGQAIPRGQIPQLPFADFRRTDRRRRRPAGSASPPSSATLRRRPAASTSTPSSPTAPARCLHVGKTTLDSDRFPSLTPDCPQVHLFEREIAEQYGVRPEGHPWLKPVRFHASYRPGHDAWGRTAGRSPVDRRHGLLPRRGRGDPRGRRRPGPRRRHRAGPLPLPVPRRAGLPPGDLARLPAPRRRSGRWSAARTSGPSTRWRRWPATRRSATRRPTARRSRRSPAARSPSAPRCCAASPWSWNGWPTTPATWAPWPATSASCRPPPTAAASAATS